MICILHVQYYVYSKPNRAIGTIFCVTNVYKQKFVFFDRSAAAVPLAVQAIHVDMHFPYNLCILIIFNYTQ